ncbi:MAG: radical SAM protein, partial [Elusimicrobiota bacterium]|nr:radical SAM protein [Elusimicrobiota bacterium]
MSAENSSNKAVNDHIFSKKHFTLWGKIRRFIITNHTAYAVVSFLRLKKLKNFFENLFSDKQKLDRITWMMTTITRQPFLSGFLVDVVSHCNLNCKYCGHFSPLVKEQFMPREAFEKDMRRMSVLSGGDVGSIRLMGGEPLLHPELLDFLSITKKLFPKTTLIIVTNGILLQNKDDAFWQALKEMDVIIYLSKYPIKINLKKIDDMAYKFGVRIDYVGLGTGVKTMFHCPFDLSGSQNATYNYLRCGAGNGPCAQLENGKFFTCGVPSKIYLFNQYFNQNLEITEKDYVDIYKINSMDELLDQIARPIP